MAHNGTQHGTPWHIPGHSIASIVHSHRTWWYWCWTMATLKIYLGHWWHHEKCFRFSNISAALNETLIKGPKSNRMRNMSCLRVWNMFEGLKYVWGLRVNGELIEQMLLGAPEPINSCLQKELLILHAQIHLEAQVYQVRQFTSVLKCI